MENSSSDFALGYAMADSNNSNGGDFGFGGGGWGGLLGLIVVASLFGWGGMGGAGLQGMATRADINEGFALQGITSGMTPTTFGVTVNCTRAHAVTFLYKALGQ